MADEAFALSPISARAAQPSEEDYDAISEAFMETSRGRWFLGEYAKRNRNADTSMVLDAVARIEETLAAQNKPAARSTGSPRRWPRSGPRSTRREPPPRRRSTISRWRKIWRRCARAPGSSGKSRGGLREIGADGRICDLIDSQVGAIEGACGQIAAIDPAPALSAAFDLIEGRIAAFDESECGSRRSRLRMRKRSSQAAAEQRCLRRSDDASSARRRGRGDRPTAEAAIDERPWQWPRRGRSVGVEARSRPRLPSMTAEACRALKHAEAADAYDEARAGHDRA